MASEKEGGCAKNCVSEACFFAPIKRNKSAGVRSHDSCQAPRLPRAGSLEMTSDGTSRCFSPARAASRGQGPAPRGEWSSWDQGGRELWRRRGLSLVLPVTTHDKPSRVNFLPPLPSVQKKQCRKHLFQYGRKDIFDFKASRNGLGKDEQFRGCQANCHNCPASVPNTSIRHAEPGSWKSWGSESSWSS